MSNFSFDVAGGTPTVQVTSTGTSDVQSASRPADNAIGVRGFFISVETTDARVTFDGSTPSATNGHLFYAGNPVAFVPVGSQDVQVLSTASADAVVNITWVV
jgi:hypothetical protein